MKLNRYVEKLFLSFYLVFYMGDKYAQPPMKILNITEFPII